MNIFSQALTHVGMVRTLNEDAYLERKEQGTWAVADGMGGHDAGELASGAVIAALESLQGSNDFNLALEHLATALKEVNESLVVESSEMSRSHRPGSTVAALHIQGPHGAVAWAGDSRVYRRRDGLLEQMTKDHSQVQELLDAGLIRPEEAEHHPLSNIITRAIGIEIPLALDLRRFTVQPGDQFLLCSDGLSGLVSDEEMNDIMIDEDVDEVAKVLLHTALVRGAPDNVTLICIRIEADNFEAPTLILGNS